MQIAEIEPEEEEYGVNTIEKILLFVSHRSIVLKDGIILPFGNPNSGIFVGKMTSQQLFYIGSYGKIGDM